MVEDEGGGSVVLPGTYGSSLASQDFASTVFVGRAKRDIGRSFISMLVTDREGRESASYNRVVGPDFQWRPNATEAITGQWLVSDTRTPNRPDLAQAWTGQSMISHAGQLQWSHNTTRFDSSAMFKDVGDGFRAEAGFVPQVGYRESSAGAGWTFRPTGFVSKLRTFVNVDRQVDRSRRIDRTGRSAWRGDEHALEWIHAVPLHRRRHSHGERSDRPQTVRVLGAIQPFTVALDGCRERHDRAGHRFCERAAWHRNDHERQRARSIRRIISTCMLNEDQSWVNVDDALGVSRQLFIARVSRVRGTYTFTSRMFVRGTAQYVSTNSDPSLYALQHPSPSRGRSAGRSCSRTS